MKEIFNKLQSKEELTEEEIEKLMVDCKSKYNNTKFIKYVKFNKYSYINYLSLNFDYNDIDPLIQELIVNLNVAGLTTRYSCSGHDNKHNTSGYIFFEPDVGYEKLSMLFRKLNTVLVNYAKISHDQLSDRSFYIPDIKLELVPLLDFNSAICSHIFRWEYAERYLGSNFNIDRNKVITNDIFLDIFNKVVISNLMLDVPSKVFEGYSYARFIVAGRTVSHEEYKIAYEECKKVLKELVVIKNIEG